MRKNEDFEAKCRKKQEEVITEDSQQLLTVEQVAHRLNVGIRTVWRLDAEKKFPAPYRIGHRKRWELKDLELWLQWKCPNQKKFNQLKERMKHEIKQG